MKFFMFHLMPWPYLEEDFREKYDSAWVTYSNSNYDPKKGIDVYNNYLDQLAYADEVGFDGVSVNEHHQTPYGLMPSPNIMAATLIPRIKKGKIAILGNAISLRDNPVRIAEEIAMLDVLSEGRIINGFVRGIGSEYHSFSKTPTESRERFHEAHDLIMKAWTEPGPFEFYGKYFKQRYVNPWVRPVQDPPPVWMPSQGSSETLAWTAEKRYTYVQTYSSINTIRRVFKQFKEETQKCGYEASPYQIGWALPIYVADTDEKALKDAEQAIDYLFNSAFKMPKELFFPSGYLTLESAARVLKSKRGIGTSKLAFDYLVENEYILVGSAETVRQKLAAYQKEFGFGNLIPMMQFGNLSHEKTMENIKLFSEKVMPQLRGIAKS